jgi:hypothetical protein
MARKRRSTRARRARRAVYRTARKVRRRLATGVRRLSRRRRPSSTRRANTVVVIPPGRAPARKRRGRRRPAFGRAGIQRGEMIATAKRLGLGIAGAITTSALVGVMPGATAKGKAFVALLGGGLAYMLLPRKMGLLRALSIGGAVAGGVSLTKQFVPAMPLMAGMDDYYSGRAMGMNIRPRYTPDQSAQWRAQMYRQNKARMIENTMAPSRNASFSGMGFGTGAQYGKFITPGSMM